MFTQIRPAHNYILQRWLILEFNMEWLIIFENQYSTLKILSIDFDVFILSSMAIN